MQHKYKAQCPFCKREARFISHYEEWESPIYWCENCGALGITYGAFGGPDWTKPKMFKAKGKI
jgi:hypothetical protein